MTTDCDDATGLAERIAAGELSAVEALDAAIDRAERADEELNFFTERLYDTARARAEQIDATPKSGMPFAGVPYLLKDMFDVEGTVTGFGSRLRSVTPPAAKNYAMVDALAAAGLNIFGKTTLGEFGYLPTTESIAHGISRNPWDTNRTPGGSSGGSAAAVAAGVVPMADAADGGGSIRIPAACCGLFGLKPSRKRMIGDFGADGTVHLVAQNCLSRTVRDTANLMAVTERTGTDAVYEPIGRVTGPGTQRLRIGIVETGLEGGPASADVAAALTNTTALLESLGHTVETTTWPFDATSFMTAFGAIWVHGAHKVNTAIEAAVGRDALSNVIEPYTIAIGDIGATVSADDVAAAVAAIDTTTLAYEQWFDSIDVLLAPVTMTAPIPVGEIDGVIDLDGITERVSSFVNTTMLQNATGAPAMSVPLAWTDAGLPIGMQFSGPLGSERRLLELAFELEAAQPWAQRTPPVWVG